jgi:quinolinate synthase
LALPCGTAIMALPLFSTTAWPNTFCTAASVHFMAETAKLLNPRNRRSLFR